MSTSQQVSKQDGDGGVEHHQPCMSEVPPGPDSAGLLVSMKSEDNASPVSNHGVDLLAGKPPNKSEVIDLTADSVTLASATDMPQPQAAAVKPPHPSNDSYLNDDLYGDDLYGDDDYLCGFEDQSHYDDTTGVYTNHDGTYGGTYL